MILIPFRYFQDSIHTYTECAGGELDTTGGAKYLTGLWSDPKCGERVGYLDVIVIHQLFLCPSYCSVYRPEDYTPKL